MLDTVVGPEEKRKGRMLKSRNLLTAPIDQENQTMPKTKNRFGGKSMVYQTIDQSFWRYWWIPWARAPVLEPPQKCEQIIGISICNSTYLLVNRRLVF